MSGCAHLLEFYQAVLLVSELEEVKRTQCLPGATLDWLVSNAKKQTRFRFGLNQTESNLTCFWVGSANAEGDRDTRKKGYIDIWI